MFVQNRKSWIEKKMDRIKEGPHGYFVDAEEYFSQERNLVFLEQSNANMWVGKHAENEGNADCFIWGPLPVTPREFPASSLGRPKQLLAGKKAAGPTLT